MGVSGALVSSHVLKSRPHRAAGIFFVRAHGGGDKLNPLTEQVDSVFRRVLKATT
jgi:hypothetical protein